LIVTWKAIRRQAVAAEKQTEASRALIEAAQQQTIATNEAARAAKEQSKLLELQYEQDIAPLLVAKLRDSGPTLEFGVLKLTNVGAGSAFQVTVFIGKVDLQNLNKSYSAVEFSPSTLGPGDGGETIFRPDAEGFMSIRYRGADRIERYTIVSTKNGFWQEHWVRSGTKFICL
jgi:hypothetical protein